MVSLNLECFELRQNGHPMYIGVMSVRDLSDPEKVRADMWARENPDGYQREPTISRVLAFARYISKGKGTSPLSVLISLRSVPKFHQKSGNFGVLEIPDNEIMAGIQQSRRHRHAHPVQHPYEPPRASSSALPADPPPPPRPTGLVR